MTRQPYPSDLTDAQWKRIAALIPPPKVGGRPARISRRELVNACLYVVRNGVTWRALPHDLPKWQTVYYYFKQWEADGTWERIHETLRDAVRVADGRAPSPSAAISDAQSVKTAENVGVICGSDGGTKVKGRKRHIAVDMLGLLLVIVVTEANLSDRAGTHRPAGLRSTAEALDCGAHVWLAEPLPAIEQGLRGVTRDE